MQELKFFENQVNMGGGLTLPVRSTLVTLESGHRVLISPIMFTSEQIDELKLNPPNAIVAPNCFHHLFIKNAIDNLKTATLFAAPNLPQKRTDLPWTVVLDDKTWTYENKLALICLKGAPKFSECVFFHKNSKTLIVTDLFFNLKNLQTGLRTLVYRLMGTYNKPSCSRLLNFLTEDKNALKASLNKILAFDFERLVMAHGEIIESGSKEIFIAALNERGLI